MPIKCLEMKTEILNMLRVNKPRYQGWKVENDPETPGGSFAFMKGKPGISEGQHPAQMLTMVRYKSSLRSSKGSVLTETSLEGSLDSPFVTRHPTYWVHRHPFQTSCLDTGSSRDAEGKDGRGDSLGHSSCGKHHLFSLPLALRLSSCTILELLSCTSCVKTDRAMYFSVHVATAELRLERIMKHLILSQHPECWQKLPLWVPLS